MSDDPKENSEQPVPAEPETETENADAVAAPFPDIDEQSSDAVAAAPVTERPSPRLDLVLDIPVRLSVELGRTEIAIREVVGLGRGSIVELDRTIGEPMDVRVNGILVGRGEIVVVNEERLGLRFTEVVSQAERSARLG